MTQLNERKRKANAQLACDKLLCFFFLSRAFILLFFTVPMAYDLHIDLRKIKQIFKPIVYFRALY